MAGLVAEEIKVLNVDGTPHVVNDLPENIQRMVEIYNKWRQDEIDAKLEVMKIEGGMRNLSGEIIQTVRSHLNPAEAAPAEVPAVPAVSAAPEVGPAPTSELDPVAVVEDSTDV